MLPFGLLGGGAWLGFLLYATNEERVSASVVKQLIANLKDNSEVSAALGDQVTPEPAWWLAGRRPWINGKVRLTTIPLAHTHTPMVGGDAERCGRRQFSREGFQRRAYSADLTYMF